MSKPLQNGQKFPAQFRTNTILIRTPEGESNRAGADLDAEKGIVRNVTVSSEEPYSRFFGTEILSHEEKAVNLARMKKGATPLLFNHNRDELIGKSMNPRLEDGKLIVDFKFSKSPRAQQMLSDLRDGILTECSIGYSVDKFEVEQKTDTYTATKWTLFECSLVSIPADFTVGVGRAEETQTELTVEPVDTREKATPKIMAEPVTPAASEAPKIDVKEVASAAVKTERKRVSDIRELETHFREKGLAGRKIETRELADKCVREEKTVEDFQREVITGNFSEPAKVVTPENDKIGADQKDLAKYSLTRAMFLKASGKFDGLEREMSDAHQKKTGQEGDERGFFIPQDVLEYGWRKRQQVRALFADGNFSGAGALVADELHPESFIELLRNKMVITQMGARYLSGLKGNVQIPLQSGGATASWLAEDATMSATQQTVGQLALVPHRLGAATAYTYQLLAQSSIDVENFVREDLMKVIALAKDLAAIAGTGNAGQPLGILNTTNLSTSVTFANAQTMLYSDALIFENNVAINNADFGSLGYLTTPTVRKNAKAIAEISAANSNPVWKNDQVNGFKAFASNQVPTATSVIFGNWDDLIIADWAGQQVIVDPYSLSLAGQVRIVVQQLCDNGLRHSKSFSVSTN